MYIYFVMALHFEQTHVEFQLAKKAKVVVSSSAVDNRLQVVNRRFVLCHANSCTTILAPTSRCDLTSIFEQLPLGALRHPFFVNM